MAESTPSPGSSDAGQGRCDSCGRSGDELTGDDLAAVHRVYVTPAAWDSEERVEVVADLERWCFACRSHYPHQLAGTGELEM